MALVFKEGVKKHYAFCEKYLSSIVFGKGLRKTAARTLLFLSEAVSGRRWGFMRPEVAREKEPLMRSRCLGKKLRSDKALRFT